MTALNVSPANSKGEKLARRLSNILALLHQGDCLDKHSLAHMFHVDVRTIERDLADRLHGIVERNASGLWQLTHTSRSTIPAKQLNDYAQMLGMQRLFPDSSLRYLLTQLEKPSSHRSMQVQAAASEDLGDKILHFASLESAIEKCANCSFEYKGKPRKVQPYRLVYRYGIWYLAATEDELLKNFSVALITNLHVDEKTLFTPKSEHFEYIDGKDDVWFTPQVTEVVLRVAPVAAHYFARRALLPKQQHRADVDGSLIVTSKISHPQQLLSVVRYWLPHVRILQPTQWHDDLVSELKNALGMWESTTSARVRDTSN